MKVSCYLSILPVCNVHRSTREENTNVTPVGKRTRITVPILFFLFGIEFIYVTFNFRKTSIRPFHMQTYKRQELSFHFTIHVIKEKKELNLVNVIYSTKIYKCFGPNTVF